MVDVFFVHGARGNPKENWFPWMQYQCEDMGCKVLIPAFPTPDNQSLKSWMGEFEKYKKYVGEKTIMIGHSIGCAFILRVLEKLDSSVKACILIAGFTEKLGIEEFDELNESFLKNRFDWNKIKKNCKKFYVLYSNNDPYVPERMGRELCHNLDADCFLVRGAGHFNLESGFDEFPMVFNKIKEECKKIMITARKS